MYSDKELAVEMERAGEQLRHQTDWAVRSTALRRIHGLVLGGACEFASFPAHLKAIREPLVAQCSELRSSLVRECCALLVLISSTMREAFEPFCADYFPPLLKQVGSRPISSQSVPVFLLLVDPIGAGKRCAGEFGAPGQPVARTGEEGTARAGKQAVRAWYRSRSSLRRPSLKRGSSSSGKQRASISASGDCHHHSEPTV